MTPLQHNYGVIHASIERNEDYAEEHCAVRFDHVTKLGRKANVLAGPVIGKVVSFVAVLYR